MTPTRDQIDAALKGHPDTITAHRVLAATLERLEQAIATMALCKSCADGVQMVIGGTVVSEAFEDEEESA